MFGEKKLKQFLEKNTSPTVKHSGGTIMLSDYHAASGTV